MNTKKKYKSTTREMNRGISRYGVDRWPRGTHTITANTKKELEEKKKKIKKKVKKISDSFQSLDVYLEGWKDECNT